jgi:hypothetical protein
VVDRVDLTTTDRTVAAEATVALRVVQSGDRLTLRHLIR